MLVGAVLTPQRADDAKLGKGGSASEHRDEPLVLALCKSVLRDESRGDRRVAGTRSDFGHQAATRLRIDSSRRTPSLEPRRSLQARSGCGIMPSTFPFSPMMPAIFRSEPFGFASTLMFPLASAYLKTTRPSPSRRSSTSLVATNRPS